MIDFKKERRGLQNIQPREGPHTDQAILEPCRQVIPIGRYRDGEDGFPCSSRWKILDVPDGSEPFQI